MHYLVVEETTEGLAASDPFEGGGVFLGLPDAGATEILEALEGVFGMIVPAVACPGQGAWVDARMVQGVSQVLWPGGGAGMLGAVGKARQVTQDDRG